MVDLAWRGRPSTASPRAHDQAVTWLRAIGGTSEVVNETVIVSVESPTMGPVTRHMAVDVAGCEREEAVRRAFVGACEELRLALG
jgi:hypothetical protein